jgi:hypothetical protein
MKRARVALVVGNVFLTLALLALGFAILCPTRFAPERVLGWRQPAADESVPAFAPLRLKLDDEPLAKDRVRDFEVVWKQVDVPPPPAPVATPSAPKETAATALKLILVVPDRAMLVPVSGGEQLLVAQGEPLPRPFERYRCITVDESQGVVTLEDQGHEKSALELAREGAR